MKGLIILISLISSHYIFANTWYQKLKWPTDRVQDQVKLLPFGQEFKLNYFLERLQVEENINIQFYLIPSLEGKSIEEKTQEILANQKNTGQRGLLFLLSLSDRQFKIAPNSAMTLELSEEEVNHLVQVTIPSLSQREYSSAIQNYLQSLLFFLNKDNKYKVPDLTLNKNYNWQNFLFFIVCGILIFMLGHKLRKSPKVIDKSVGLVKHKGNHRGLFW